MSYFPDYAIGSYKSFFEPPPRPRFNVPNKKLAVEPFPADAPEKEIIGGVLRVKQRGTLQALKVVFGNDIHGIGAVVYLRASRAHDSTWGKEVFEVEGQRFILVPDEEVLLADRQPKVP